MQESVTRRESRIEVLHALGYQIRSTQDMNWQSFGRREQIRIGSQ